LYPCPYRYRFCSDMHSLHMAPKSHLFTLFTIEPQPIIRFMLHPLLIPPFHADLRPLSRPTGTIALPTVLVDRIHSPAFTHPYLFNRICSSAFVHPCLIISPALCHMTRTTRGHSQPVIYYTNKLISFILKVYLLQYTSVPAHPPPYFTNPLDVLC